MFRPSHNPIPAQKPGIDGVVEDSVDLDRCPFGVSFRAVSLLVQPGGYLLQGPTLPAPREHLPHQGRLTLVRHESAFEEVVAERRMESQDPRALSRPSAHPLVHPPAGPFRMEPVYP